jgi:hypothetical protein
VAILLAIAVALLGQEAQVASAVPTLHSRPLFVVEDDRVVPPIYAPWIRGAADFPEEAAGFYRFRDPVQGVEIDAHGGEISGYLLKFGRGDSDKDLIIGYLINGVTGERDQLRFTTRQVHGIWYTFDGRVVGRQVPGDSASSNYALVGTLTMHDEAQQTTTQAAIHLHPSRKR